MNHIFLYGPPAAGKTTVGRLVARNLKMPFVDLDEFIVARAGSTIPGIMERDGEAGFREIETSIIRDLANEKESVIALGGGALLRDENRTLVEGAGRVIVLMAGLEALLERMNYNSNDRPLLKGDVHQRLAQLLAERDNHYRSFQLCICADGQTAEQAAFQVQTVCGRHHLEAMGHYDAIVQAGAIAGVGGMLLSRGLQNPVVVTDENVQEYHGHKLIDSLERSGFERKITVIPAGENHKNQNTITHLWKSFLEHGVDRKSTVLALGGGVIGDMAGFAASTYMRGVRWVCLPTSLLAMVDASLGGKTGFDLPEGKNMIGSFHPPSLVLADPLVLKTLPEAELISGMAEVLKHGVISDPELFAQCSQGLDWVKDHLEEIVKRATAVKIKVIEQDPFEHGLRAALNLGHTVGHAVELASGFSLRHGEAIAIGMVVEAGYAVRSGLAVRGLKERIAASLAGLGLPTRIPQELSRDAILQAMRVDKKKHARLIRFALPVDIGQVKLVDVTKLEAVLEDT